MYSMILQISTQMCISNPMDAVSPISWDYSLEFYSWSIKVN